MRGATTAESMRRLADVVQVDIDEGIFKYVLLIARERSTGDVVTIVRGYKGYV